MTTTRTTGNGTFRYVMMGLAVGVAVLLAFEEAEIRRYVKMMRM
jgi:hypothetical protein